MSALVLTWMPFTSTILAPGTTPARCNRVGEVHNKQVLLPTRGLASIAYVAEENQKKGT